MKVKQITFLVLFSILCLSCFFNTASLKKLSYKQLDTNKNDLYDLKVLSSYGKKRFLLKYPETKLIDSISICSKVINGCSEMFKDSSFGEKTFTKTVSISDSKFKNLSRNDTISITVISLGEVIELKFTQNTE